MTNRKRDEFPQATKRILADRAALRCSNPDCRALTKGPSSSAEDAQNVGCASHITAAASGGPRYDISLTSGQRRSPENGIWLCRNCGDLVDNDSAQYSAALLRKWKADIELEVELSLGKTAPLTPIARAELHWLVDGRPNETLALSFDRIKLPSDRARSLKYSKREIQELSSSFVSQAEEYNRTVDRYCERIIDQEKDPAFLAWLRKDTHATKISLVLRNPGTIPLERVTFFMTFPRDFILVDARHPIAECEIEKPPQRPREIEAELAELQRRSMGDLRGVSAASFLFTPGYAFSAFPAFRNYGWEETSGMKAVIGLTKSLTEASLNADLSLNEQGNLEGCCRSVMHKLDKEISSNVKMLAPFEAGTWSVEYRIHAANLPIPATGQLTIVTS